MTGVQTCALPISYKNVIIKEEVELGTFVDVEIIEANRTYLLARLIE